MREIKIIDHARQRFAVVLNNRRVTFEVWYSRYTNRWSFDLMIDNGPILQGRRIVLGVDLLRPFNFGVGAVFALADLEGAEPGRDELPRGAVRLYHATQEEIDAAVAA